MKKIITLLCFSIALFILAGCSSPISSAVPVSPTPTLAPTPTPTIDGYLSAEEDNIAWVKLVVADSGNVSGQWIGNDVSSSGAGEQLVFALSGTYAKANNAISMNLQGPLGVNIPITGTLKNNVLDLQLQQNGATKHRTLNGASEAQYQTALSAFQAKHPYATPTPAA